MTSLQDKANPPPSSKVQIHGSTLWLGDCIEVMATLDAESIDSIVTDPPYGIRFMGKAWDGSDIENTVSVKMRKNTVRADSYKRHDGLAFAAGTYDTSPSGNTAFQIWTQAWALEAFRILRPGGHLLSFASPRTYHRMTTGIEDAGFEIRDQIMWLFGSGFPKSHNLDGNYEGWGTALKPAHEPIVVARKPLKGTVADNMLRHGTGALNIDASRISTEEVLAAGAGGLFSHIRDGKPYPTRTRENEASANRRYSGSGGTDFAMIPGVRGGDERGRWPANVIHDGSGEVLASFPQATGQQAPVTGREPSSKTNNVYSSFNGRPATTPRGDSGSAARFYYCAKASKEDRDEGLDGLAGKKQDESRKEGNPGGDNPRNRGLTLRANHHPTVKPTDLMRYLCRLVTPRNGIILDPFMGSGSTGKAAILEGFRFFGIEREGEYFEIAHRRIQDAQKQPDMFHMSAT